MKELSTVTGGGFERLADVVDGVVVFDGAPADLALVDLVVVQLAQRLEVFADQRQLHQARAAEQLHQRVADHCQSIDRNVSPTILQSMRAQS